MSMMNPRAAPHLIEALHEEEVRLNLKTADPWTMDPGDLFKIVERLASIHTDEAIATINELMKRIEKEYSGVEWSSFMLRRLQQSKEKGLNRYQERQKQLQEKLASEAVATSPSSELLKTQPPPTSAETARAAVSPTPQEPEPTLAVESAESSDFVWFVSLAVAFLAGIGYVFYYRKRGAQG